MVTLFADSDAQMEEPERMLRETLRFSAEPVERVELVREIVGV